MQHQTNEVDFLFSDGKRLNRIRDLDPEEVLSDTAIDFLAELSSQLTRSARIREYPDVATFAFFCRRANILSYKKKFVSPGVRLGRGIVFHIAPSNVPVNFAYSMIAGILSGNINIVRVPSKNFEQVDIIIAAIKEVVKKTVFAQFEEHLFLVRYDRTSSMTNLFSSLCDVRVIWGGDNTIDQIRKSKIPARAFDITFADRYSIAVINADELIHEQFINKIAEQFYNDTYLFDQNACSAPHLIVWTGLQQNIARSKSMFWNALQEKILNYSISPVQSVDKLSSFYLHSVAAEKITRITPTDNKLWRTQVSELAPGIENFKCAGGYFMEYDAETLDELKKIVNRKYQTLAYYGYKKDDLVDLIRQARFNGIDRVVPIGRTTDFDLIWDGYDLLNTLSRECFII